MQHAMAHDDMSCCPQLTAAQQQASIGASAIMEASALREEVKRERSRADSAMRDAESVMKAASSSSMGLESQLLEAVAALRLRTQVLLS